MYIKLTSVEPTDDIRLFPAPGVNDIKKVSYNDKNFDENLEIVDNYRGSLLILENGAQVYRHEPSNEGCNGYYTTPTVPEDVYINYNSIMYKACAEFISSDPAC
jgi:hypothetical protein